jgi:hypothetical protein
VKPLLLTTLTHLPACQAQKPARSPSPPTCLLAKLRNLHACQAHPLACLPSSKTCTLAKPTHLPACQAQKSARSPSLPTCLLTKLKNLHVRQVYPFACLPSSEICTLAKVTPAFFTKLKNLRSQQGHSCLLTNQAAAASNQASAYPSTCFPISETVFSPTKPLLLTHLSAYQPQTRCTSATHNSIYHLKYFLFMSRCHVFPLFT